VFNTLAKTTRRISPMLRRVLIVDPQPASSRMLGELLRDICQPDIWTAPSAAKALKLAAKVDPQVIFCALSADGLDGGAFTRALRHGDLACRQAPVILVTAQATAAAILAGRDAGAHEFVRCPFTLKDLSRRLEAVTLHPRGWVEAVDYVGPDRRRFNSAEYQGPLQRLADQAAPPEGVRIGEALKIVRAALAAIDREPSQALRAMLAQTTELTVAAGELGDTRLATANNELHRYLFEIASLGGLNAADAARYAQPLLAYGAREARSAAQTAERPLRRFAPAPPQAGEHLAPVPPPLAGEVSAKPTEGALA
jgi:CheY-like chemotaxis protein